MPDIRVLQNAQCDSKLFPDGFLGWRMNTQSQHSRSVTGRKAEYVCEVGIERDEDPALLNRCCADLFIRGSTKADLIDCDGIEPVFAKTLGVRGRKILVEQKLHEARTISSMASLAAYCSDAETCSRLICGHAARICSAVSPAASFSRIMYTGIRVPLRQGFPIITSGRVSMYSGISMFRLYQPSRFHSMPGRSRRLEIFASGVVRIYLRGSTSSRTTVPSNSGLAAG